MRIGLIAGNGQFPIIFSKEAKAKGFSIYAVAHNNETDPALGNFVDVIEWIYIGQINRIIKYFKKNHIDQAVLIGGITKTKMFSDVRPDTKAIAILAKMKHTHDDGILRSFVKVIEQAGIKIQASTFLLPHLIAREGCWTRRKPNRSEKTDIDLGWRVAKDIGRLDIGQCVVVGGGSVLAVEAIDGTDATIMRGGGLGGGSAIVVKACKPNQDMRFDMPSVGVHTIEVMHEAEAKVLVVEADKTIVFDQKEMIKLADEFGISILAMGQ